MSKPMLSWFFVLCALQIATVPARAQTPVQPSSSPLAPEVARPGEVRVSVESVSDEKPVEGAKVTLTPVNAAHSVTLVSDQNGVADFKNVAPGDYLVEVTGLHFEPDRIQLHVNSGASTSCVSYLGVPGGEKVLTVTDPRRLVDNVDPDGGSKIRLDSAFIDTNIANSRSLQALLNTAPGMQSDANGQVHIRGEHKSLEYEFDGLNVPNGLSSNYASLFDPRFVDDLSIRLGNYDASHFGQLGAVVSLNNDVGKIKPYVELEDGVGDHHLLEEVFKAEGSNSNGTFDYFFGAHLEGTNLRTESPQPRNQDLANTGRDLNIEARFKARPGDNDKVGFTFIHQNDALGIPQDLNSYLAGVRQNQYDRNDLALLSWDHDFDKQDAFKLGLTYFSSGERYTNNGVFTPFIPFPASLSPDLNAQGAPADPSNPGSPYLPTSLLNINQFQQQLEFTHKFDERNSIQVGANADFISSGQNVSILDAGGGGSLPNTTGSPTAPNSFSANSQRNGFFGGVFFSQNLSITDTLSLNYGLRAERFDNGAGVEASQLSPRVNLLWAPDDHSALRVSYNSLFQPPPLEIDVSGLTTAIPQTCNQYEINYQLQPTHDLVLSLGYVYKSFKNQLDVGLLIPNSNVPIFAPLNFNRAFYDGVEFALRTKYTHGLNGFLSATYGVARPTQGSLYEGTDLPAYNDHDQRAQVTGGVSETWGHGWFGEGDFLFGTGYPQDTLAGYNAVGISPYGLDPNGARLSHFYLNASIGYKPVDKDGKEINGPGFKLQVLNLLNNRSDVNFLSGFSGTRFSLGRQVILNTSYRF